MTSDPIDGVDEAGNLDPIFILGMRPRSGTHFLANLLCQHPDCVTSALAEDSLLIDAQLIAEYVKKSNDLWTSNAGKVHPGYDELLLKSIGDGLISFLTKIRKQSDDERARKFGDAAPPTHERRRLVTKTPSADNLRHFFGLFPEQPLLILIRDGRAIVESSVRSFGGGSEDQIRAWANAANRILRFVAANGEHNRKYMIVRFEDLHAQTEVEMSKILAFLGLDANKYDFQAAQNLPVVGSSTFKRPPGKVQWLPVRKNSDFDPIARADEWTRSQHERFNWIAGKQLEELGYSTKIYPGLRLGWTVWNLAKDFSWSIRKTMHQSLKRTPV